MGNIVFVGGFAFYSYGLKRAHANQVDIDIVGKYDDVVAWIKTHKVLSIIPIDGGKKLVAKVMPTQYDGFSYSVIEAEIAWRGSTAEELLKLVEKFEGNFASYDLVNGNVGYVISVDLLYTLKMSHRYLRNNPHFMKTMLDIRLLRSDTAYGYIPQRYAEWFDRREKETYTYAHPKLNVSKDEFFKDDVPYIYDHDSIHEAVKIGERPAYTYFLEGEVKTSQKLFDSLPKKVRLNAVYEEACVLALERSIIPYPDKVTNGRMQFLMALEKVCTSITSGWFREFAWENYSYVSQDMFDSSFLDKFRIALEDGKILPHKKND